MSAGPIFTIGHSTRSVDEFADLLRPHGVHLLVDVRTIPKSRTNPQFNRDSFPAALQEHDIEYRHIKELGGLRRTRSDSPNTGWRNDSFRGYADYMATEEFRQGLDQLIELANDRTVAIMCAEAVPWRCHRSLIADALLVRGIDVFEIIGNRPPRQHKLTSFARVDEEEIVYPASER